MPGYVQAALLKFQSEANTKPQDAPHRWNQTTYGSNTQYADTDNADLVDVQSTLYVQLVCGAFLCYAIAVDQTMLVSLNDIATAQAHATTTTMGDIIWLLNYAATHPDATLYYHAINMIIHVVSDASYLCEECAVNKPPTLPTNNGAIHTMCQLIKTVVSSAAEAKMGTTVLNAKDALTIRTTIKELGHPQPTTPMQVDNTTAVGFTNNTIKQKRSNSIDMRFYWIRDRSCQGHFKIYRGPGSTNLGD